MKTTLIFVPPGGGEADYSLDFDLPSVPQAGDYISIMRPNATGTEDFIVRRTWWLLSYPDDDSMYRTSEDTTAGTVKTLSVECEQAIGPWSNDAHKRACPPNAQRFDNSCY